MFFIIYVFLENKMLPQRNDYDDYEYYDDDDEKNPDATDELQYHYFYTLLLLLFVPLGVGVGYITKYRKCRRNPTFNDFVDLLVHVTKNEPRNHPPDSPKTVRIKRINKLSRSRLPKPPPPPPPPSPVMRRDVCTNTNNLIDVFLDERQIFGEKLIPSAPDIDMTPGIYFKHIGTNTEMTENVNKTTNTVVIKHSNKSTNTKMIENSNKITNTEMIKISNKTTNTEFIHHDDADTDDSLDELLMTTTLPDVNNIIVNSTMVKIESNDNEIGDINELMQSLRLIDADETLLKISVDPDNFEMLEMRDVELQCDMSSICGSFYSMNETSFNDLNSMDSFEADNTSDMFEKVVHTINRSDGTIGFEIDPDIVFKKK